MGFDIIDDDDDVNDGARTSEDPADVGTESGSTKERWRKIEEESRKPGAQREVAGEGEGEDALPEPDAEGRRMAETEEVHGGTTVFLPKLLLAAIHTRNSTHGVKAKHALDSDDELSKCYYISSFSTI